MRHALRVTRKAVFLFAVLTTAAVWSRLVTAQSAQAQSLPVYGVVAFLDHTWSEHFTSSAGYSLIDIVNSNAQLASDFHKGDYAIANLLYHPIPKVMMGGEFQFGRRENFRDGFNFNDYRVQFSFKYDWDKSFKSPSF
jgi:hypothetical protein